MRLRKIGVDPQGFGKLRNGLLILAQVIKNNSQVAMRLRIIGVDPQGFGKLRNGLLVFAQSIKSIPRLLCGRSLLGDFFTQSAQSSTSLFQILFLQ